MTRSQVLRSGRALRQVARGPESRQRRAPVVDRHPRKLPRPRALCADLPGQRTRSDRGTRSDAGRGGLQVKSGALMIPTNLLIPSDFVVSSQAVDP